MSDFILRTYLSAHTNIFSARERLREESGAEAVQVIMIMGIMAVLVIAVMSILGGGLKGLAETVKGCVSQITGSASNECKWNG